MFPRQQTCYHGARCSDRQDYKTLAAKKRRGDQCEVISFLWNMDALRLRDEAPGRTEQSDAANHDSAVVAAAYCALKASGVDLTPMSPHKSSNTRREELVATTIFTPASIHSTSANKPHGHHKMVPRFEQTSLEETIVPLPGLGQTPRPGTFPSSVIVDGKVITFDPGKLGRRSPSDPPFICPWQRLPSSATDARCTRSQSSSCIMANHYNNAAGICHPLGAVGLERHGTPCWCFECLKFHKLAYGVNSGHSPSVHHQSDILGSNSPIAGNTAIELIVTDADITMFNAGPAVTTANAIVAPTTLTPSSIPKDIRNHVAGVPQTQTQTHTESEEFSEYSVISSNAPEPSSWDLTSPVSVHTGTVESIEFSSVDDDDGYDESANEEVS
ncbi:hypothetical protein PTMSG1_10079 [Pyrenophora teres f. maculata]|nr:hypothetical protein PTMSG1_10079 [Pyrenophora teres f. maculata]